MAKDILGLLSHIPAQKIHILGNSLGGLVGPKLLENGSDRIASLSTGGTAYRLKMFPAAAKLSYGMLKLLGSTRLANMLAKRMISNPETRPFAQKFMNANNPELIRHIQKNIACYEYEPIASNFAGPLLILRGELDSAINKRLDVSWGRLSDKPNAKLVNLPGVGHFTNLDNPKLFRIALLSFFSKIATDALGSSEI